MGMTRVDNSNNQAAAKPIESGLSNSESFQRLKDLAAASKMRVLTPEEELEIVKRFFGPQAEIID